MKPQNLSLKKTKKLGQSHATTYTTKLWAEGNIIQNKISQKKCKSELPLQWQKRPYILTFNTKG